MKCPVDASHEGIKVVLTYTRVERGIVCPHYAKAVCAECGERIKWLSKKQADALEKGADSTDAHLERHKMLHAYFDELLADWIENSGCRPSEQTIFDLMQWSGKQSQKPDHPYQRS